MNMLVTFTLAISSFHFSTLEEYYTGGLFLGPGNGISDGSAGIISLFTLMGLFGNEWLQKIIIGEVRAADIVVFSVGFVNFIIIVLCVKGIIAH
jgi:hypothetical protein